MRIVPVAVASAIAVFVLAATTVAQTSSSASSTELTARVSRFAPSVTSEISTTVVVAFENHTTHPITVAHYHVEWNGGRSREGSQSFEVAAHATVERRMHIDGDPRVQASDYRVVFALR